jgi:hypothetical protein
VNFAFKYQVSIRHDTFDLTLDYLFDNYGDRFQVGRSPGLSSNNRSPVKTPIHEPLYYEIDGRRNAVRFHHVRLQLQP